jgi:murein DD-endopeptidase MepM/ murein hydrolase activator NlpD
MALKTNKTISSPLVSALNNIVSINRSGSTIKSTQQSYEGFLKFMDVEIKNIEAIPLPKKKDVKKLSNLNVAATFGSAGSLLSALASGALDAAGFVGDFFSGKKRGGAKPNPKAGGAIPKGKGIRLGGVKALGIVNAAFAGLDFAQGLQEGESVGKAAAGAGGALAGSIIGAALGSVGGPLGSIAGSMAGNFLGGYLGDRAHEVVTGTGNKQQDLKRKQKEKLKAQEAKQKAAAAAISTLTIDQVMDKFDNVVFKFERVSQNLASSQYQPESSEWEMGETAEDKVNYRPEDAEEFVPTGDGDEVFPLVGGRPNLTPSGGTFTASRGGGKRRHNAQDIGVDPNTPVVASRSGKVLQSYPSGYGDVGGAVVIRYDNGQQGLYGHVNPSVKVGDNVKAGQKIARVSPDGGNTHLHYMRKDTRGNYIDPKPILEKSKSGVPTIKPEKIESKQELKKQSQFDPSTADISQQKPTSNPPGALVPGQRPDAALNSQQFKIATETREQGKQSGMQGEELEKYVAAAVMNATNTASELQSQVQPTPSQIAQSLMLEQYPTYNQQQSSTTIVPILMSAGGGQQRPQVISVGGGGGGGQTIMLPGPSGGHVLNSLLKTMLLTNLSGT